MTNHLVPRGQRFHSSALACMLCSTAQSGGIVYGELPRERSPPFVDWRTHWYVLHVLYVLYMLYILYVLYVTYEGCDALT